MQLTTVHHAVSGTMYNSIYAKLGKSYQLPFGAQATKVKNSQAPPLPQLRGGQPHLGTKDGIV